jgi:hypothetical protein
MMTEYFNIGFYLVTIWAITNETNLCHVWSGAPIRAASYSHHYRLLILDANLLSRQHYLNYQVKDRYKMHNILLSLKLSFDRTTDKYLVKNCSNSFKNG